MSRKPPDSLLPLVESFFQEHLRRVRGASPRTVMAYRDAVRLFLCFLAESGGRPIHAIGLDDIVADRVLAFLDHLETVRGNGIATRNQRLAAIRAFAEHLIRHDPTRAGQFQRILAVPTKKPKPSLVHYLEPEEVKILLRQPDLRTSSGRRDRALLLFLYNTGARISEALGVRRADLQLERPRQVRVHGKGAKDRFCPLWKVTGDALAELLGPDAERERIVFLNARGRPLTRDGAAYLLDKYVRQGAAELPTLGRRRVTPHVLRHSCAVALLQAGLDITVIRDYLGHTTIATTSRYVSTNLDMKREVLDAFWRRSGLVADTEDGGSNWRATPDVLAFLDSL